MELHRPSGRLALGFGLASTTMLLWGVLPLALRRALREIDPVTLTGVRFTVSAVVLCAVLAATGRLPALRGLDRTGLRLLAVATLGLAANYIGYLLGLDHTSPANAQVMIQTGPLLLALGGLLVFGERFNRLQWIGFGVLVLGLGVFFAGQLAALGRELGRYLAGVAWIGFAAITWAIYGLAQKQLLRTLSSQGVMLCIYVGCALFFVPFSQPSVLWKLTAEGWWVLAFCTANTLVAYGAFAAALEHWEASRVSAVLALTPLGTLAATVVAARALPAEGIPDPLSATSWAGALLVVGGSLLTALGRRPADLMPRGSSGPP
jgi:drug/metabolite transporter (DMT)-like permease